MSIERSQAILKAGPHTGPSRQLTVLTVHCAGPEARHDPCFVSNGARYERASACAPLWNTACNYQCVPCLSDEHKIQMAAVMTNAFDFSIPQYAVIEARRTDGPSERFVIAYSDERALRDLIAGPSIIGWGFATREQAQGHADVRLGSEQPEGPRTTRGRDVVLPNPFCEAAFASRI